MVTSSDNEQIQVVGATEGNLRNISLNLPLGQLVVFAGVSGSGKSTFAVEVLHAESQRRYLEAATLGGAKADRSIRRPDVVRVQGVPPTLALHQRPSAIRARATVGDVSGVGEALRVLYGCAGALHCPSCGAEVREWTQDEVVAWLLALPEGSRVLLETPWQEGGADALQEVMQAGFGRIRVGTEVLRVEETTLEDATSFRVVVDRIKVSSERRPRMAEAVRLGFRSGGRGLVVVVDESEHYFYESAYCGACDAVLPSLTPALLSKNDHCDAPGCGAEGEVDPACGVCHGTGLHRVAGAVRWQGKQYLEAVSQPIGELTDWLDDQPVDELSGGVVRALREGLAGLCSLGLKELTLGRRAVQLSHGELQRLRVARHLTTELAGVLYVLDEPCVGLDDTSAKMVVNRLREVVSTGSSILCVSHQDALVRAADWVVCWGPGPGSQGGQVLFEGTPQELARTEHASGRSLRGDFDQLPSSGNEGEGAFDMERCVEGSASWQPVRVPLGCVVAFGGDNATGKSALMRAVRDHAMDLDAIKSRTGGHIERVLYIDGAPSASGRGMLATYSGVWTPLRKLLSATHVARVRGFGPGVFSLAVKGGRCEACQGAGRIRVEMGTLPGVEVTCEVCDGRRFQSDVLDVRWRGHSPDELLSQSVHDAQTLFADIPMLARPLRSLCRVGLGYLRMDHPLSHLSGGEAARLQLARELARTRESVNTLYLIEHPEQGLHPFNMTQQWEVLAELVRSGGSVWLTTHDRRWRESADHLLCFNDTRYRL